MKKITSVLATSFVLALTLTGGISYLNGKGQVSAQNLNSNKIANQYIVVLKDNVDSVEKTANDFKTKHGSSTLQVYNHSIKGMAINVDDNGLKKIKADPRVEFVSEDRIVNATGKVSASTVQTLPNGINRIDAENKSNTGADINVAVIDTGIDLSHPDLKANIVGGKNCSSGKSYADGNGHGTHVSGTIAAINNTQGVVGVAPQAKLWAVRVLDNRGSGSWSSVICGIDFVTANASVIKVANMSLGGTGTSDNNCGISNNDALHKAICRSRDAGVTYVVAAGNETDNASNHVPAAYDDAVITVSALADSDGQAGGTGPATSYGADDTFASFSNYGSVVDIGAPGVDVYSTLKGGGYGTMSGTSMASPHVTGSAALYIKSHPGATWTDVRDGLKSLGTDSNDVSGLHPEKVVNDSTL